MEVCWPKKCTIAISVKFEVDYVKSSAFMSSQATSIDFLKLAIFRLVAVTKLDLLFYGS